MYYPTFNDRAAESFTLPETDANKEFIAAFRDSSQDLSGRRFTLDVIHGWAGDHDLLTFTITPASRITLRGKDFEKPHIPDWPSFPSDGRPLPKDQ